MEQMEQVISKIDTLIRARMPVIAVQSHEETRVETVVAEIAKQQGKRLITWSISRGFVQVKPDHEQKEKIHDPAQALLHVADSEEGQGTLYLFKDLSIFLSRDPRALRALRDAAHTLIKKATNKGIRDTLLLVSPTISIPEDAKKDVRVLDFPLPTAEDLLSQVEGLIANLPEEIEVHLNGSKGRLVRALQGLTETEADGVLAQAAIENRSLDERAISFVLEAKAQIIRESGALEYYAEKAGYAEIGGLDLLKAWAREAEAAATPEAKEFGVEAPKAVLLVGVPGCGKSLTAKAIAGSNRPLLRLDAGALFGSLVGQSEERTRQALKIAEAVAPAVLWIDEIEKALGGSGGELNGGVSDRVLGTILTWMQETAGEVFVVATANDIGSLRPELVRRFDEVFFVDLPQEQEREEILSIHLQKRNRRPGAFDLSQVVQATADFTGAELEKVVKSALRRAFHQGRELETGDLLECAGETVPLVKTMPEGIQAMRDWASRARPASSIQPTGNPAAKGRSLALEF